MRLLSVMAVLALSSMWGDLVKAGPTYSATEIAYVSEVSGRVVAFMQGRPTFLDALDVVADQTRSISRRIANCESVTLERNRCSP